MIVRVNGSTVASPADVALLVCRGGEERFVALTLAQRGQSPQALERAGFRGEFRLFHGA